MDTEKKYNVFKITLINKETKNKFTWTMLGNNKSEIEEFFNDFSKNYGYDLGYSLDNVEGPLTEEQFNSFHNNISEVEVFKHPPMKCGCKSLSFTDSIWYNIIMWSYAIVTTGLLILLMSKGLTQ